MSNEKQAEKKELKPEMIQIRNTEELQQDIDAIKQYGHDTVSEIVKVAIRKYRKFLEHTDTVPDLKIMPVGNDH